MTWQPLETCPHHKPVVFGWANGSRWIGILGGYRGDTGDPYFYGPAYLTYNADDNPPSRWCEIPAWEDK